MKWFSSTHAQIEININYDIRITLIYPGELPGKTVNHRDSWLSFYPKRNKHMLTGPPLNRKDESKQRGEL